MDKMRFYELYDVLQFVPYTDKAQWQTTRFLSLVIAQKFCKKRLKLSDMFELPWDDPERELELSEEGKIRNIEFQNQILELLNKNTSFNNGSIVKNGTYT